jgi:Tfp pilus assembly protein PilO
MSKGLLSWQIDVIAVAAMGAIALGAYSLQIRPAYAAREERAQRAGELAAAREKSADLEMSAARLKEKLRIERESIAQSVQLESSTQLNARLAKLTELAGANNLQLDAIEPGASAAGSSGRYETIPIRLAGRGAYHDAARFVRALHEALPDTGVGVLELTSSDNGGSAGLVVQLLWHTAPHGAHEAPMKVATTPQN